MTMTQVLVIAVLLVQIAVTFAQSTKLPTTGDSTPPKSRLTQLMENRVVPSFDLDVAVKNGPIEIVVEVSRDFMKYAEVKRYEPQVSCPNPSTPCNPRNPKCRRQSINERAVAQDALQDEVQDEVQDAVQDGSMIDLERRAGCYPWPDMEKKNFDQALTDLKANARKNQQSGRYFHTLYEYRGFTVESAANFLSNSTRDRLIDSMVLAVKQYTKYRTSESITSKRYRDVCVRSCARTEVIEVPRRINLAIFGNTTSDPTTAYEAIVGDINIILQKSPKLETGGEGCFAVGIAATLIGLFPPFAVPGAILGIGSSIACLYL